MHYLLGAIACSAVFAQSYKFALTRGYNVDGVSVASFTTCLLALVLVQAVRPERPTWPAIALGLAYGAMGATAQLTYFRALRYGGVAVSWTIVQMCILIPVLAGVLFWSERPSPWQSAAIVAVGLAVLMMGDVELGQIKQPLAWVQWLSIAFVCSGLGNVCMKALSSLRPAPSQSIYLLAAYSASLLVGLPLLGKRRPRRAELATGLVRGAALLSSNLLVLRALTLLPGYLVFATYAAAGLANNLVLALLLWGERPKGRAYLGIGLALGAIVLLSR